MIIQHDREQRLNGKALAIIHPPQACRLGPFAGKGKKRGFFGAGFSTGAPFLLNTHCHNRFILVCRVFARDKKGNGS